MTPEEQLAAHGLHFEEPRIQWDVPDHTDEDTGELIDMSWAAIIEVDVHDLPGSRPPFPDTHTTTVLTAKTMLAQQELRERYIDTLKQESVRYITRLLERQ